MLSPSRTNSGCGANRPVRPSLAVGAKVGKCDVQTVEPPAPEAAVAIEVHAASTVARSIIEKNLTARARKEANIKASLPKLSGRKVRKAPKAPKAPRAAAAAAAAAVTDRAVCQEVHSDQTWNAFRWIPTTVVRVTSEWADDELATPAQRPAPSGTVGLLHVAPQALPAFTAGSACYLGGALWRRTAAAARAARGLDGTWSLPLLRTCWLTWSRTKGSGTLCARSPGATTGCGSAGSRPTSMSRIHGRRATADPSRAPPTATGSSTCEPGWVTSRLHRLAVIGATMLEEIPCNDKTCLASQL
eukprot:CAMPEP_0182926556 /NCGR_PEP_ID=MMETSP0105_2-20130417/12143_1 /TAXON_ID=81532 ORGANISM="Acanthoeca-like sp., Strain 10tr" /NCGR_SAMPLE_ID=MMETSP0105_2 /ASSEMBLY_ACC=CAM_ASM_000205 /LENGTH=301 /DNA_ID=CAMNT_0025064453 /DNA_START=68 /DNA_END=977 /DNA_ORIENTATION=-